MEAIIKLQKLSDRELVASYRKGNPRAFEALVTRHRAKLMSSILTIVKDRDVAEDILQEALIKMVDVLQSDRYKEEGKFLPWALRMGRNMAIDHFRRERRTQHISIYTDGDQPSLEHLFKTEENIEKSLGREETKQLVRALIAELPIKQREVLMLRHYNEMSFKEIAKHTDVSINTALGRMRYALINLRKIAEEKGLDAAS